MMVLPERSLGWIERWCQHGLRLGKHDGEGNLVFEHDPGDAVAADMVAELRDDGILLHGVAVIIVEMLRRENDDVA